MNSIGLFLYNCIKKIIPESRGFAIKRILLRLCGVEVEENVRICSSATFLGSGKLHIGANTWVGHDVLIVCTSSVKIGDDVDIAPRVYIGTGTHRLELGNNKAAGEGLSEDIIIGNGCWLCVNSTLLPGVTIGDGVVVAAGAIVNKSFPSKTIIAGIPAKIIRNA